MLQLKFIMEDPVITHELTQLDYTKVAALQQKRTLAFVTHFVLTTVQFLNTFVAQCESKLKAFERKIQKVEASLIILETKLSSVSELEDEKKTVESPSDTKVSEIADVSESQGAGMSKVDSSREIKENKIKSEYERFVKMVQVGVPIDAVKLKITLEGLDPDCLDLYLHK